MAHLSRKSHRAFAICAALGVAVLSLGGIQQVQTLLTSAAEEKQEKRPDGACELDKSDPDSLRVSPDVVRTLGIRTAPVQKPARGKTVTLPGTLALEATRLARVHTRFGGEIVEVGMAIEPGIVSGSTETVIRQLQVGDKVAKNQLLVVIWSKDLGEKKSELVDALSQLRLDQIRLEKFEDGYQRQAIPEASVRQTRRDVEQDLIAVARAERTLRVWRLAEDEIAAVKQEAERIRERQGKRDKDKEIAWARVEVRAPSDGVILERNVALGEIVDTATDLFKIADLSRLCVWAHAYESQLPDLVRLPRPISWTVRLKADPGAEPRQGVVNMIGSVVDPVQHTAVLRGYVENVDEKMRAGQFITATIELPPAPDELLVPIAALVEDGQQSTVMVQPDPREAKYALRTVKAVRRSQDVAFLKQQEAIEKQPSLRPGDQVVIAGALALKTKLGELKAMAK